MIVWAITEIMKRIMKITANHFAITNETPEIIPNPNRPVTIAINKKINDQTNQFVTFSLFSVLFIKNQVISGI